MKTTNMPDPSADRVTPDESPTELTRPRAGFAAPARSPCISMCRIDPADELCVGCQRTLDEIATWGTMSPEQRLEVWRLLAERRASASGNKR